MVCLGHLTSLNKSLQLEARDAVMGQPGCEHHFLARGGLGHRVGYLSLDPMKSGEGGCVPDKEQRDVKQDKPILQRPLGAV